MLKKETKNSKKEFFRKENLFPSTGVWDERAFLGCVVNFHLDLSVRAYV